VEPEHIPEVERIKKMIVKTRETKQEPKMVNASLKESVTRSTKENKPESKRPCEQTHELLAV
jgi:hypothetical protein